MKNTIVRFEIGCDDRGKAQAFYGAMFDWKITEGAGPSLAIDAGGGPAGGIVSLGHDPRQYTLFYVQVEDVAAALEKAKTLGGKALVGPIPLPNGSFAWMTDPEGNVVGLWQAKGA